MENLTLGIVFIEGIITFLSPCFLPLIPIYLGYLSGEAVEKGGKWKVLINSLGFVLGFTMIFVLLGATASSIGKYLLVHRRLFNQVLGVLIVIMGLFYMGLLKINFLNMEKRFSYGGRKRGFLGAVLLGAALGFGWSPCIGPILGSVLLLAASKTSVMQGVYLLFIYSMGIAIPFIVTALIIQGASFKLKNILRYNHIIKIVTGIILVVTGILLYTGLFERMAGYLGGFGL
jgi:cytochrome c-type biogenesis protein